MSGSSRFQGKAPKLPISDLATWFQENLSTTKKFAGFTYLGHPPHWCRSEIQRPRMHPPKRMHLAFHRPPERICQSYRLHGAPLGFPVAFIPNLMNAVLGGFLLIRMVS